MPFPIQRRSVEITGVNVRGKERLRWDRVFGTYIANPKAGQEAMTFGINAFRDPEEQRLDQMLSQPFRDGS